MARINGQFDLRDWPAIVEEYRVNTLLLPIVSAGRLGPIDGWGMVFWDDASCVLVRRTPQNAPLLSRLEYRLFRPGWHFQEIQTPGASVRGGEMGATRRAAGPALVARELEEVRAKILRAGINRPCGDQCVGIQPRPRRRLLTARWFRVAASGSLAPLTAEITATPSAPAAMAAAAFVASIPPMAMIGSRVFARSRRTPSRPTTATALVLVG
jgi:hypothetical protein